MHVSRGWVVAAAWGCALLAAAGARAQEGALTYETFEPMAPGLGSLNVPTAPTLPGGGWAIEVWTAYSREALTLSTVAGDDSRAPGSVVDATLRVTAAGSYALVDGLALGAAVPFVWGLDAQPATVGGRSEADLTGAALGDLQLALSADVLQLLGLPRPSTAGVGLGAGLLVWLPTGAQDALAGEGNVRWQPHLDLDWRGGGFLLAASVGYHLRPEARLFNLVLDDEIRWGLAGEAPLFLDGLALELAVTGALWLADQPDPLDLTQTDSGRDPAPIDGVGAVRYTTDFGLELAVGGGRGLNDGVGAPATRVFARLGFATPPDRGRTPGAGDADGDGVPNAADRCPFEPERRDGVRDADGCPEADAAVVAAATGGPSEAILAPLGPLPPLQRRVDGDADGLYDDEDACPDEAEDFDGYLDGDGCPDIDPDGDGIVGAADACPTEAEIVNGLTDEDGCPDRADDADGDGVEDRVDLCPLERETPDGVRDGDGCPEAAGPRDQYDAVDEGLATAAGPPLPALPPLVQLRDRDGDGLPAPFDACDDAPEDLDGFEDGDGCPEPDDDGDGVPDATDRCPRVAGSGDGCPKVGPDADGDGVGDAADRCPFEPETRDGVRDEDGCPESAPPDPGAPSPAATPAPLGAPPPAGAPLPPLEVRADLDGDGLVGDDDDCPSEAEDADGFEDTDGCPELDDDADGLPDAADACPRQAETVNAFNDDDGCPDEVPDAQAEVTGIVRGIQFRADSARLLPGSLKVLAKVAKAMGQNPGLRLEIQGHTDARGERDYNLDLSKRRALAVKRWLVDQGIDATRMRTKGFGPDRPTAPNSYFAGRMRNRRVELVYTEVRDPATKEVP